MVIYIEATESDSMLENLPDNINVYAITSSNAEESSSACYYGAKLEIYLGDCYSVAWMENSDEKRSSRETLYEQYSVSSQRANQSKAMEHGNIVRRNQK